jgi:hypothetical protein
MVTEAERGLTVRTTATVGELLEAWFEFASPDFSPKTVKETRGYIDRSTKTSNGDGSASIQVAFADPAGSDLLSLEFLLGSMQGGLGCPQFGFECVDGVAELANLVPRDCGFVTGLQSNLDGRWFVVAAFSCTKGAHAVGVGAPLAGAATLAGHGHGSDRNET